MYNDDFNQYNGGSSYHYVKNDITKDDYQSYQPVNANTYTPTEKESRSNKGKFTWWKALILVLVMAVVSAACGFGGAALYRGIASTPVTVYDSKRENAEVTVKEVSNHTLMTAAEVYAANANSVVSVNCSSSAVNIFGQTTESASSGSGFIVSENGYIVTNQHVVSGASAVSVTLYDGQKFDAKVIGGDEDYDIAVLKVEATDLQPVVFGDSDNLNVGDTVLAIGNPLGELTFSMSQGIVSMCDRAINVDGTPFNMIQIDCSVNPGNSGGPLFNLYGEVIGIVSAKYSSYSSQSVEGLGFAIPIDDVHTIMEDIVENGQVTGKAYFAMTAGSMTESMAQQYKIAVEEGVFIYSVEDGGAAQKAGLRLGDVITAIDGTEIEDYEDLVAAKKQYKAGETAELTIFREGNYMKVSITFDEQPANTSESQDNTQQQQQQQQQPQDGYDYFGDLYDWFFNYR